MSLTFAAETLGASQYGIRVASETENHMTSVERVFTYTEIDPEPGYNNENLPPEGWPTAETLTLHDLSLAYLKGAPAALNNINISVAAKEKVGVVGRTGAGKSSLVAALFRIPEPNGNVRTSITFSFTSLLTVTFCECQTETSICNRLRPSRIKDTFSRVFTKFSSTSENLSLILRGLNAIICL